MLCNCCPNKRQHDSFVVPFNLPHKALYNECKAKSECHAKQKQKLFWMPLPVLHHTRAIPKGSMQMNSATKSSKSLYNDPFLFSFFFSYCNMYSRKTKYYNMIYFQYRATLVAMATHHAFSPVLFC